VLPQLWQSKSSASQEAVDLKDSFGFRFGARAKFFQEFAFLLQKNNTLIRASRMIRVLSLYTWIFCAHVQTTNAALSIFDILKLDVGLRQRLGCSRDEAQFCCSVDETAGECPASSVVLAQCTSDNRTTKSYARERCPVLCAVDCLASTTVAPTTTELDEEVPSNIEFVKIVPPTADDKMEISQGSDMTVTLLYNTLEANVALVVRLRWDGSSGNEIVAQATRLVADKSRGARQLTMANVTVVSGQKYNILAYSAPANDAGVRRAFAKTGKDKLNGYIGVEAAAGGR
jgi:hypothetical protein